MASNNSIQLSQLISRLWQKTQAGSVAWEQLAAGTKYQARFGEYVIFVWGRSALGLGSDEASIEVKRLNGTTVAQGGVGTLNALATVNVLGQQALTPTAADDLRSLFTYLSTRNPDLDELLRLIG